MDPVKLSLLFPARLGDLEAYALGELDLLCVRLSLIRGDSSCSSSSDIASTRGKFNNENIWHGTFGLAPSEQKTDLLLTIEVGGYTDSIGY